MRQEEVVFIHTLIRGAMSGRDAERQEMTALAHGGRARSRSSSRTATGEGHEAEAAAEAEAEGQQGQEEAKDSAMNDPSILDVVLTTMRLMKAVSLSLCTHHA